MEKDKSEIRRWNHKTPKADSWLSFFPPCLSLGSEHFVKDLECTLTHSYTWLNDTILCWYVNVLNNTFLLKNAWKVGYTSLSHPQIHKSRISVSDKREPLLFKRLSLRLPAPPAKVSLGKILNSETLSDAFTGVSVRMIVRQKSRQAQKKVLLWMCVNESARHVV